MCSTVSRSDPLNRKSLFVFLPVLDCDLRWPVIKLWKVFSSFLLRRNIPVVDSFGFSPMMALIFLQIFVWARGWLPNHTIFHCLWFHCVQGPRITQLFGFLQGYSLCDVILELTLSLWWCLEAMWVLLTNPPFKVVQSSLSGRLILYPFSKGDFRMVPFEATWNISLY